jgi:hypothetical protein
MSYSVSRTRLIFETGKSLDSCVGRLMRRAHSGDRGSYRSTASDRGVFPWFVVRPMLLSALRPFSVRHGCTFS